MKKTRKKLIRLILEVITVVFALIYIIPVFLVLTNSFKPLGEILKSPFTFPKEFYTESIVYVFGTMNYLRALWNTVRISIAVVILCILVSSMVGWMLTRDGSRLSKIIMALLMASLMVPFQSFMIPIAKLASNMHINDSQLGYIWIQVTLYVPMGVFMYTGFVKSVSASLEEAARLDGASVYQVFFRIAFPLMKPITASIAVLYSLWIWNDYMLASIMMHSESKKTITLSIYSFFSMYNNRWDYAITAVAFSVIPISIVYVLLQKYVIAGVTAGAVKG